MPHAFIGVDVIVGMNGETDEMFQSAYTFMQELDFSQLHVFTYSERPDTKALKIEPKNQPQVKKERSRLLLELSTAKHEAFCESQVGFDTQVIFEEQRKGGDMFGYTNNYVRVKADYDQEKIGQVMPYVITKDALV